MDDEAQEGRHRTFLELWLAEMTVRIVAALGAMLLSFLGSAALGAVWPGPGPWVGALVGLAVGFVLGFGWLRRRDRSSRAGAA